MRFIPYPKIGRQLSCLLFEAVKFVLLAQARAVYSIILSFLPLLAHFFTKANINVLFLKVYPYCRIP